MLINIIKQYATEDADKGNWPAVVTTLSAQIVERRSSGRTTLKQFIEIFGVDASEAVLAGWSTSELGKSLRTQLEVIGLDFSDTHTIELIDKLDSGSKWPTGIAAKLKEFGVWFISPAESIGLEYLTPEECQSAWELDTLNTLWASILNNGVNSALAVGDKAALVTALEVGIGMLK